jgi:hypothetical protein
MIKSWDMKLQRPPSPDYGLGTISHTGSHPQITLRAQSFVDCHPWITAWDTSFIPPSKNYGFEYETL